MTQKTKQMNRRTFIKTSSATAAALGSAIGPFIKISNANSNPRTVKKLFATTDYSDNVLVNKSYITRQQLDDFHKGLADLGVTRHQWIVSTYWLFYENHPHGIDLLSEVVKSAHAHGIELYALIKNFEDGGVRGSLPHTMPFPEGVVAYKNLCGISFWTHPFTAKHPEMCLKRRPGTLEYKGPVTSIRLVKDSDEPTRVKAEHLSIWTSETNNRFKEYKGPVSFRETIEWRPCFPKWEQCRILHLEKLNIPKEHKYILIRCSLADSRGDFSNEIGQIIEIAGPEAEKIPFIFSKGPISYETINSQIFQDELRKQSIRYFQHPQVKKELSDSEKLKAHYTDFYNFDEYYKLTTRKTLDNDGFIAVACGKLEYMFGDMHPIYPEVRKHWLDITKFCLDRGVDGINFRMGNHTRSPEYWEYGFNEPVLQASGGRTDYPTISKINGDAYTLFLREAKQLIKSRGKGLTLHLHAGMLMPDDRGRLSPLPPNFEWQWETWVREIADDLEFRGIYKLRPWNLERVLDTFSAVTREMNKPLYLQSDFHSLPNDEVRLFRKRQEIELLKNHPGLDGFVLYETANFAQLNDNNHIEIKDFMKDVINSEFTL